MYVPGVKYGSIDNKSPFITVRSIFENDIPLILPLTSYAAGPSTYMKSGIIFGNFSEAYNHLGKIINNNDLLMIKGSNATGLNQFSKNIKKEQISAL